MQELKRGKYLHDLSGCLSGISGASRKMRRLCQSILPSENPSSDEVVKCLEAIDQFVKVSGEVLSEMKRKYSSTLQNETLTHLNKNRILLIDDSRSASMKIAEGLQEQEFEVVAVQDYDSFMMKVKNESFDCILIDYDVPQPNGPELAKHLKNSYFASSIPLLMLMSDEPSERILESIEAGADDFVEKKLNSKIIAFKIRALIQAQLFIDRLEKLRYQESIRSI